MNGYDLDRPYIFQRDGSRRTNWYRRRRRAQRGIYCATDLNEVSQEKIVAPENLLMVYDALRREGGEAPGIDGLTYSDFSRTEVAEVLRKTAQAIREGRYRPYPTRLVRVPKGDGRFRELRLPTIIDRTIAKAVAEALTPALDAVFLPGVMGFRPGRSTWTMLLEMERIMVKENRWVIALADIRDAFPSAPIEGVVRAFRQHVHNDELLNTIETILRGHDGKRHEVGLDQGSPLAPLSINVLLDDVLDRPISADPHAPPLLRYADDIVSLHGGVTEGRRAIQRANQSLNQATMMLKTGSSATNLQRQGAEVRVLGFVVRKGEGRLRLGLDKKAWGRLSRALEIAHQAPDPAKTVLDTMVGWLEAMAPALKDVDAEEVLRRVHERAARYGFRESPIYAAEVERKLHGAVQRWENARRRT